MKTKLKSAAIPISNLPRASLHSMATQTEFPSSIVGMDIIKELHNRGVQDLCATSEDIAFVACSSQMLQRKRQSSDNEIKLAEDAKTQKMTSPIVGMDIRKELHDRGVQDPCPTSENIAVAACSSQTSPAIEETRETRMKTKRQSW